MLDRHVLVLEPVSLFAGAHQRSLEVARTTLPKAKELRPIAEKIVTMARETESVHARRYLLLMRGKIGSTEENMEAAFQSEIKANVDEYPNLIKEATDEGEEAALKAFSHARDVEDRHAELYKKAMNNMLAERETIYYVCQVCGYVAEDEAPQNCPVCGAVKGKFKKIE